MSNDQTIEQEIKACGADVAPRITPADIEANISNEYYFTAAQGVDGADIERLRAQDETEPLNIAPMCDDPQTWRSAPRTIPLHLLTFCVLVLKNGFTVTGESACASPENFNAEIGRKVARTNAITKIWPLMGYELKQRMSEQ